jgi:hypothetical protein
LKPNRVEKRIKSAFLLKAENLSRGFETIFLERETLLLKRRLFGNNGGRAILKMHLVGSQKQF